MKILQLKPNIIDETVGVLKSGGLVIAPSDTVYGLLCDATSEEAVKNLVAFKERPAGRAISVFVSDLKMMRSYVDLSKKQELIVQELLPGPFTVVLKSKHKTSKLLESEKGTLGVRIPKHEFINKLVKKFGRPITATSANLSGKSSVYDTNSLLKTLSGKKKNLIDLVIDSGKLPRNRPSTVLDLTEPEVKTLREGNLKFSNTRIYETESETETKEIAKKILKTLYVTRYTLHKPLIFILKGDLGAGKTVFVKGVGEMLGIKDIISPTFVIYYEYEIRNRNRIRNKLIHVDLYNLEDPEEFNHLGLEKYLKPGNIFCIEWGEKSGPIIDLLKNKGQLVFINIKYITESKREITVNF